jgi:hypothetical protein
VDHASTWRVKRRRIYHIVSIWGKKRTASPEPQPTPLTRGHRQFLSLKASNLGIVSTLPHLAASNFPLFWSKWVRTWRNDFASSSLRKKSKLIWIGNATCNLEYLSKPGLDLVAQRKGRLGIELVRLRLFVGLDETANTAVEAECWAPSLISLPTSKMFSCQSYWFQLGQEEY